MFDDDDRFESARRLAEEGDSRAVAAFRGIAADEGVGDDVREEAALALAEIDSIAP
jgi:HEAT repeat protein